MILLIDNYDSFVHNLARYLERLGIETCVKRNDALTTDDVRAMNPAGVLLSPGPGSPKDAGISVELVQELYRALPILGICLGHQAIATALGGRVVRSREPMHGRTSPVFHDNTRIFTDLPSPFRACRYHSLVVPKDCLPEELRATAHCEDGTIMALEHRDYPLVGLQFHPESILTSHGYFLLCNFLDIAGIAYSARPADLQASELQRQQVVPPDLPSVPVTF